MTIIEIIKNHFSNLSNKQQSIARYLTRNKSKIAFMSLKELSSELKVSEVTILNFCKAIGVDSFIELKKEFQTLIKEELQVPAKMRSSLEELESLEDAVRNTIQLQRMNFDKILANNSIEVLYQASQLIQKSKTVYLCGLGVSSLVCDFLYPRLKTLLIDVKTLDLDDINILSNDLIRATKEDLFILISFPIYSSQIIRLAQYLSANEFKYIAITDSQQSPIAQNADIILKAENQSLVFYNFISATITLIELLLIVLSYNNKESIIHDVKEIKAIHEFFSHKPVSNKKNK
ncbi:DNA-binding MurR/RpiR family transcriptional regulator [Anaerosolibacter carboniphilus]|uniref:DNA-binding MurR/RpiR family transcriptional regulator n=1 Tax=Anaerosolibacter carboniphilus TaxID=1417629 RepID=A0A841KXY4_9FIRM|nr:MurR/RpiR family transcriptional regulator [Anaerosolibacter carboniphilus]MBB6217148.1 DNA-binding MurR/RpiR family transcriptional regulator [Anaerosolibacter carboniphilus]